MQFYTLSANNLYMIPALGYRMPYTATRSLFTIGKETMENLNSFYRQVGNF